VKTARTPDKTLKSKPNLSSSNGRNRPGKKNSVNKSESGVDIRHRWDPVAAREKPPPPGRRTKDEPPSRRPWRRTKHCHTLPAAIIIVGTGKANSSTVRYSTRSFHDCLSTIGKCFVVGSATADGEERTPGTAALLVFRRTEKKTHTTSLRISDCVLTRRPSRAKKSQIENIQARSVTAFPHATGRSPVYIPADERTED
jgi:hypothetical protein